MKIFIDSANLSEIEKAFSYGFLDGVTTNPSLIKKAAGEAGGDMKGYIKKILEAARGTPVSLEVVGTTYTEMVDEGKKLYKMFNPVANNVYVKVPVNPTLSPGDGTDFDGVKAIKTLSSASIPINATLIFTPEQALLAAKAGANFVSPFAGRIDDMLRTTAGVKFDKTDYFNAEGINHKGKAITDNGIASGIDLVAQCVAIFQNYDVQCEVLAASLRNPRQVRESMLAGADIATLPFGVIQDLLTHEKTVEGMKSFVADIVPDYAKLLQ